jgi:Saxitoxin biosynthesis operon protein SxtJ
VNEPADVSPLLPGDCWSSALPAKPEKAPSMRVFGLVMLGGFGVLGTLAFLNARRGGSEVWMGIAVAFWTVAGVLFLWSLASPRTLPPVYRAWMRFGQAIGGVMSTVLLTVLYFAVVTPVGLLMRAFGTDPIARRGKAASYWRPHPPRGDAESYRHLS